MNKINMLYRGTNIIAYAWHGTHGIVQSLQRQDLLDYAFNVVEPEANLDFERLASRPVLLLKGYDPHNHTIIDRLYGKQFMANIEPESLVNRDGTPQNFDGCNREYHKKFDLIFSHSKPDCENYYGRKAVLFNVFIDCEMFKASHEPVSNKLAYIGSTGHREEFLKQVSDTLPIDIETTPKMEDAIRTTQVYVDRMSDYKFLLCPPGKICRYFSGHLYEIMALGRVAFVYADQQTLDECNSFFLKDGENVVMFKTMEELKNKFEYYSARPEICAVIAKNARKTAVQCNDIDKVSKYFVDKMYETINSKEKVS